MKISQNLSKAEVASRDPGYEKDYPPKSPKEEEPKALKDLPFQPLGDYGTCSAGFAKSIKSIIDEQERKERKEQERKELRKQIRKKRKAQKRKKLLNEVKNTHGWNKDEILRGDRAAFVRAWNAK
jgi:hypothetical protein